MITISKSSKQIFEEKYPLEDMRHNPFLCAHAVGYLECLMEHNPSTIKWARHTQHELILLAMVSIHED